MSLPGAVFLSYASQDADAALRICEALRSAGVDRSLPADDAPFLVPVVIDNVDSVLLCHDHLTNMTTPRTAKLEPKK